MPIYIRKLNIDSETNEIINNTIRYYNYFKYRTRKNAYIKYGI